MNPCSGGGLEFCCHVTWSSPSLGPFYSFIPSLSSHPFHPFVFPSDAFHPSVSCPSFIVSEMTYNVSMGTLNPTIPYHTLPFPFPFPSLSPSLHLPLPLSLPCLSPLKSSRGLGAADRRPYTCRSTRAWNQLLKLVRSSTTIFKRYLKTLIGPFCSASRIGL